MLTGACLSRAFGFPARVRYATAAAVIAAELPDADYVYRLGGPLLYFQHHRGWTHAFWSLPLQAALVVLVCFLLHRTRHRWKRRRTRGEPAPANWLQLWLLCLLALFSHVALDWTNNYGVRPFAPWNPHWYAGNLVFIVEPVILAALGLALLLPLLLSLVNREIGVRRARYPGPGLALAGLCIVSLYWGWRGMQQADALRLARAAQFGGERGGRVLPNPFPIDPYRWYLVAYAQGGAHTSVLDNRTGLFDTALAEDFLAPAVTPATDAAKRSWLGRIYLDWSQAPRVIDAGAVAELYPGLDPAESQWRVVRFDDLRFRYDVLGLSGRSGRSALGAEAWVDGTHRVRRVFLGSSEQELPE